ncbi:MAG: dTMP kinase [Sphingomonadaceae bacterium]
MTGRFITLEGGEGAGKSTHAARLAGRLRASGLEVVETREPGGTPGAEAIRALLLGGGEARWSPMVEALLLNAARADHAERLIAPALARGAWVVCDRWLDSTLAYQGGAGGLPLEALRTLHAIATGGLMPHRTLLLDLPVAQGLARAGGRGDAADRIGGRDAAFHEKVRAAFLDLAAAEPQRIAIIDASAHQDSVAQAIWAAVEPLLPAGTGR